jgi:hypothetical protein
MFSRQGIEEFVSEGNIAEKFESASECPDLNPTCSTPLLDRCSG